MSGRGPDPFPSDTQHASKLTLAQQRNLCEAVTNRWPDRKDYLPFLQALLAPLRPSPPAHGKDRSPEWKAARSAWNARCRAWVIAEGRIPGVEIRMEDQRAYEAATGDMWARIEEGLR